MPMILTMLYIVDANKQHISLWEKLINKEIVIPETYRIACKVLYLYEQVINNFGWVH
jgi:hypothetical protein